MNNPFAWLTQNSGSPYNNASNLLGVGLGLLSGRTPQEQVANAATNFANDRQMGKTYNKTLQYLRTSYPELADAVESGAMNAGDAWKLAYQQKLEAAKPKNNYITAGKNLYNVDTGQWVSPPAGMGGDDAEYGLNPQYGVDANGNPVIVQLSKSGTSKQTALPDGVKLSKEPIKLDAGTHFVLLDPITRQPIGQIPKDLAGAERQKEIGTAEGKNIAAAPGDLQAGINAKNIITQLKTDPNREAGTGWSGWAFNSVPATPGYDYQNKVNQAKSGAFLTAIQQMRGLGALSNAEGDAATKAVTRMDTATSEGAFLEALNDYEKIIDQGIARAQGKMQGGGGGAAAAPGGRLRYNPQTGELE